MSAATLEQANEVLTKFIPDPEYNAKFGRVPSECGSDFRPVAKKMNLDRVFSLRYEPVVGKDHVIQFGARSIQLPARDGKYGYAGQRVELCHQLNEELHVWLGNVRLFEMPLSLS